MSESADQDNLPQILARAFVQAWERYLHDENGKISEEVARSSLAKHLVAMAKEGVKDERALTAGGLMHLIWLTDASPRSSALSSQGSDTLARPSEVVTVHSTIYHFRIDGANAKFLLEWRVPWGSGPYRRPAHECCHEPTISRLSDLAR